MRLSDHLAETPVVQEGDDGLLLISWPRHRPSEFAIAAEMFEALVVMINIERRRAHEFAKAGLDVCARWDADDVNPALMNRDVARFRLLIEGET